MIQEVSRATVSGESGAITNQGDGEMLERLEAMVVHLRRLVECRSPDVLQQPGHDGDWGVVEVLCHLRDWETVVQERVRRIIEDDRPELEEPDTAMWPLEHEYGAQDSLAVFGELAGMRMTLIERLRELDREAWEREGILEGRGVLTLREMLDDVVIHDAAYVGQARDAVA